MTWTYDSTDLSTALAKVRVAVGDTNSAAKLLTDEEINYRLGLVGSDPSAAAIYCVRDIIAKLARDYDRSNVGMSVSRSQQIQHYKDLLIELTKEASTLAEMFFGGISQVVSDETLEDDDFRVGDFSLGMDDKP